MMNVSLYRMITYTDVLRICTHQYSSYIYCTFQKVFSPQIMIVYFMSRLNIYTKRKISSKKETLELKCILQESRETL